MNPNLPRILEGSPMFGVDSAPGFIAPHQQFQPSPFSPHQSQHAAPQQHYAQFNPAFSLQPRPLPSFHASPSNVPQQGLQVIQYSPEQLTVAPPTKKRKGPPLGRASSVPVIPSAPPPLKPALQQPSNPGLGTPQPTSAPQAPLLNQKDVDSRILLRMFEEQSAMSRELKSLCERVDRQSERFERQNQRFGQQNTENKKEPRSNAPKDPSTNGSESDADSEEDDSDMDGRRRKGWEKPEDCSGTAWNILMSAVREHLLGMLKIETTQPGDLARLPRRLTENEITALLWNNEGDCWTNERYRLDFSKPWSFSPNKSALRVFVHSFARAVKAGSYKIKPELLQYNVIEGRFVQFFTYLKPLVLAAQGARAPRPPASSNRRAQNTRRKTLLDRRRDGALSRQSTQRHYELLRQLKPEHMSDDETDDEGPPKTFKITNVRWRSRQFTEMLRRLDDIYNENRRNPHRSLTHSVPGKPRGNSPRQRLDYNDVYVDGVAPAGLPLNCYNPRWIQEQPKWVLDPLKIKKKQVYSFEIDEDELRTYNGKGKGRMAGPSGSSSA